MPVDTVFRFNSICIVESLKPTDRATGEAAAATVRSLFPDPTKGPLLIYERVDSRAAFEQWLGHLATMAETKSLSPILQIEVHGLNDRTGIAFADGDSMTWLELKPSLQRLNIATRFHLLVLMVACNGAFLSGALVPTEGAPCWGMVGPSGTIGEHLIPDVTGSFYNELFGVGADPELLTALNRVLPRSTGPLLFFSAADFFQATFYQYFKQMCTPAAIERRAFKMAMAGYLFSDFSVPFAVIRHRMQLMLGWHEAQFLRYWRIFFMVDRFPENSTRFDISFERCRAHPGPLGPLFAV